MPKISARLPETGVVTAATTREMVRTHAVALRGASRRSGRWFWMGTTNACMNAVLVATPVSTTTSTQGRRMRKPLPATAALSVRFSTSSDHCIGPAQSAMKPRSPAGRNPPTKGDQVLTDSRTVRGHLWLQTRADLGSDAGGHVTWATRLVDPSKPGFVHSDHRRRHRGALLGAIRQLCVRQRLRRDSQSIHAPT